MEIINFIENHWVLLSFCCGMLGTFLVIVIALFLAVKCLLRNDILDIYDRCNETETITRWQLQSIELSYTLYRLLKGNSFVKDLMIKVRGFKVID